MPALSGQHFSPPLSLSHLPVLNTPIFLSEQRATSWPILYFFLWLLPEESVSSDFSSLVFDYVSWGGNLAAQGRSIRLGGSFSLRKGLFSKLGKKLNNCLWRCSSKTGKGEVVLHREFQGIKRTWSAWIHSPVPCNFVIHVSCVCYHLPVVRYSVRLRTPDVNGEAVAVMGQCILLCLLPAPDHQPDMREEQRISRKGVCVCVCVRCHLCEGILRLC